MNLSMNLNDTLEAELTYRGVLADMRAKGHVVAIQEIDGKRVAAVLITEPVQFSITIEGLGKPDAVLICAQFTKIAQKAIGDFHVQNLRQSVGNPTMIGQAAYDAMDQAFAVVMGREYTEADRALWVEAWEVFKRGGKA